MFFISIQAIAFLLVMGLSFSVETNLMGKYRMAFSFEGSNIMELVMTGCLAVSTGCSGVCSTDDCFILDASVFSGTKPRGSNPLNPAKIKVPKYIYCKQPVLVAFLLERRIMIQLKCKGKRIRASDRYLVYRFCAGTLLSLFVAVLLLLNMEKLLRTDWEHFSLLDNGLTLSPYNFITILIATGVCALVAFLYYRYRYDY